jgi:hypothetical protein
LVIVRSADWFSSGLFAIIALVSIAGGLLIELVMLSRLLWHGSTRAPQFLPGISQRSGAPSN